MKVEERREKGRGIQVAPFCLLRLNLDKSDSQTTGIKGWGNRVLIRK